MMSYDKYQRGRQHLNGGQQRITFKTKQKLLIIIPTLRFTQSNQWVGVDHAARLHFLNSPPITSIFKKNKMIVMMTCMACLTCMSNVSINCRSLTREKKITREHTYVTQNRRQKS